MFLVNDLLFSGFSLFLLFLVCFGNAYGFVVVVCFFLLFAFAFYVYCRVKFVGCSFIDVSCTPTGVSEINYL